MLKNPTTTILRRWREMDSLLADPRGGLDVPAFTAEWGVSERTVARDLEAFRELGQRMGRNGDGVLSYSARVERLFTPPRAAVGCTTAPRKESRAPRLRKPQVRILAAMAENPIKAWTRRDIADAAGVSVTSLTRFIGSGDEAKRERSDRVHNLRSLLTLRYIRCVAPLEGRDLAYQVTPAGFAAYRAHR